MAVVWPEPLDLSTEARVLWLRHYFSPAVREQRRRDRSHGRVVAKGKRPMVRLAAQTEKRKRGR